ncbi:MAG: thioredoxin family protein [Candidatus Levybacteria bacterium]|nr:thioredoxin family protein [Candidatus Levybacteria bacterium]
MNKAITILIIVLIVGGIGVLLVLYSNRNSVPQEKQATSSKTERKVEGYQGNVLAGNTAYYIEYNRADYEKAVSDGRVIFLDFYANWCPLCRTQAPEINAVFDNLESDKIVGFRVNYNDSETDQDEKEFAKALAITYQDTKIILKDGRAIFRTSEFVTEEQLLAEINKALE